MSTSPESGAASHRHALWESASGLKESWYVVCTATELRRRQLVAARVLGIGIAVYRRADGRIVALLDQCLHRGTMLSAGRLVDDCLVCPYHGWRYDGEGRVRHIPSQDGGRPPEQPHPYRQKAFAARESCGLVWVYIGEQDPDAATIFAMPHWREPPWVNYYMVSRFPGNVEALAQNFMDVPHTVYVHDTIFRRKTDRLMHSTVEINPASVEVTYHDAGDAIGMLPFLTNPTKQPLIHTDRFFAPNITRCDYRWGDRSGFIITSQITPEDARTCRVYTLISYRFPWPAWIGRVLEPVIHAYTRIVLGQDIRIMGRNLAGLDNAPGHRHRSAKADLVHVGIERIIAARRTGVPVPEHQLGGQPVSFYV